LPLRRRRSGGQYPDRNRRRHAGCARRRDRDRAVGSALGCGGDEGDSETVRKLVTPGGTVAFSRILHSSGALLCSVAADKDSAYTSCNYREPDCALTTERSYGNFS